MGSIGRSGRGLKWPVLLLVLSATVYHLAACNNKPAFVPPPLPVGFPVSDAGVTLAPESERPLDFFVMGIDPEMATYFLLPPIQKMNGISSEQMSDVGKSLYWLNFEMSHGGIMRVLPPYTHLFVAVPWPEGKHACSGREESLFREYLIAKCGWTKEDIERRIHFFCSPSPLVWAQDIGEILGRDSKNRAIIDVGQTGMGTQYRNAIHALVEKYPEHFALKVLPLGINAEGGDEELVWTPEGKLALMVGQHRVKAYLENKYDATFDGVSIDDLQLAETREAFSKAFYGLPVLFVPEEGLKDPKARNRDLFHLDMLVTVLYNHRDRPHAFIPTYSEAPVDALTDSVMNTQIVKKIQEEYDSTAEQLKELGYQVVRLPFADHPVRNPVNLVKYHDREKDRITVLLPRYTHHLPRGTYNPRQRIQVALTYLDEKAYEWMEKPSQKTYEVFQDAVDNVWREMAAAQQMSNPSFEKQEALFQKAGYEVIAVPAYAWGSGGLHCQVLR